MVRKDNITETVIHSLKSDYVLVSDRAKSIDFTPFTLFKRGDNFSGGLISMENHYT